VCIATQRNEDWDAPDVGQMILRLKPTKNNQELGVKWAKDYEI
jgi:hypothetical protein